MALYNRYEKLRKVYVCNDGSKIYTDEYQKGYLVQEYEEFESVDDCEGTSSGGTPTTMYQWVDVEYDSLNTDTYLCQGYDLYSVQKQQYSNDSGKTWYDVEPLNKRQKDLIESNSEVCGYEPSSTCSQCEDCGEYQGNRFYGKAIGNIFANVNGYFLTLKKDYSNEITWFEYPYEEKISKLLINTEDSLTTKAINWDGIVDICEIPDVSLISDFSYFFASFSGSCIKCLDNMNMSNATDIGMMFAHCYCLQHVDLSKLNLSKVTECGGLFFGCKQLKTVNLGSLELSQLEDKVNPLANFFYDCYRLQRITCRQSIKDELMKIYGDKGKLDNIEWVIV